MESRPSNAYEQAVRVLPQELRELALTLPSEEQGQVEEIRLRVGQPPSVVLSGGEAVLSGVRVERQDLERLVELASQASLHVVLDQICQGYLTVSGGHRLGLCGTAVLRDGRVCGLRDYSAANLRVARQIPGAARPFVGRLWEGSRLSSTLILAPPGLGKTTLLRDLIRCVSDGDGCPALRVSVADERGEVAALYNGKPQLNVGRRTDVLEGCPKAEALLMLLRAMNPQVLAVDEITAPEDVQALEQAAGCGAALLATAHGLDRDDLARRPVYRRLLDAGLFQKLVRIGRKGNKRVYQVEELT